LFITPWMKPAFIHIAMRRACRSTTAARKAIAWADVGVQAFVVGASADGAAAASDGWPESDRAISG